MLYKIRRYRWYLIGRWKIKKAIKKAIKKGKLKVVLGAGGTNYSGWVSTDLPHFDILDKNDWRYFFKGSKIDNLILELTASNNYLLEKDIKNQIRGISDTDFIGFSENIFTLVKTMNTYNLSYLAE